MKVKIQIEDVFFENLQRALNLSRDVDVVKEALTILNWAVQERRKGRLILAANRDGSKTTQLAMPSLDQIVYS